MDGIECGGFVFTSNFDSGNLSHVELVPPKTDLPGSRPDKQEPPDYEFNIWTRPDCMGSEFENGNRTWFYFGIRVTPMELAARKARPSKKGSFKYSPASTLVPISEPSALLKFNLVNMNKQAKLYAQGMAPVFRILPGRPTWERIRDRPAYMQSNGNFAISFKYRMIDNPDATTYFAFTYPYTYEELQEMLQYNDEHYGISSPYSYRNSSKNNTPEKQTQCEIDKKKPLIVKLTNQFKNKRKGFINRRGNEISSLKTRPSMEKQSLPDVCVQEVFKNCTNMDQESEHLLNKMTLEQTISKISEPILNQKKLKKVSTSVIRDVTKSSHSKNLKTILPPAFSNINIDTTDEIQSTLDISLTTGQLSHSSPETNTDGVIVSDTISSPDIMTKNSAMHTNVLNSDDISGKYRAGELSPEMAVHVARHPDDIYYCRELLINTIQDRRVDLLTITSYRNISLEREERLPNLFPDIKVPRPHKFRNKKIIFLSARVHPGETPSSFVLRGFLVSLLDRACAVAAALRRMYVFKIIPFLNPDGVVLGHYRTDSRGCNLNRVYDSPDRWKHPSVYAARALIRYYHSEYPHFYADQPSSALKCKPGQNRLGYHRVDSGVSGISDAISLRETTNLLRVHDPMTPLRKLQDTLRASIDLMSRRVDISDGNLTGNDQTSDGSSDLQKTSLKQHEQQKLDQQQQLLRTPLWCDVCLASVYKLEANIPGIKNIVPCMTTQLQNNTMLSDSFNKTGKPFEDLNTTIKTTGVINLQDMSNITVYGNTAASSVTNTKSGNTNTVVVPGIRSVSGNPGAINIQDMSNTTVYGNTVSSVTNTISGNTNNVVLMPGIRSASGNTVDSQKMCGVASMATDVANMAAGIADVATGIACAASGIAHLASGLANNRTGNNTIGNALSSDSSNTTVTTVGAVSVLTGSSSVNSPGGSSGVGSSSVDSGFYAATASSYDRICRNCRLRTIREHPLETALGLPVSTRASSGGSSGDDSPASTPPRPAVANWLLKTPEPEIEPPAFDQDKSGLFLYIDMHGHASKRGIFMYGNHINAANVTANVTYNVTNNKQGHVYVDPNVTVHELPKVMAVNSLHFHYTACNFSERNMYVKDRRDGSSREGCGRVSVWKQTGLLRSYTLECNYNTGRCVNVLPAMRHHANTGNTNTSNTGTGGGVVCSNVAALGTTSVGGGVATVDNNTCGATGGSNRRLRGGGVPPKYGPSHFEEVGRALGPSILDLTDSNPRSRLTGSEYRGMRGVREALHRDLALDVKVARTGGSTTSGKKRIRSAAKNTTTSASVREKGANKTTLVSKNHKGKDKKLLSDNNTAKVSPLAMNQQAGCSSYGEIEMKSVVLDKIQQQSPRLITKRRSGGLSKKTRSIKTISSAGVRLKTCNKTRTGVLRVVPRKEFAVRRVAITSSTTPASTSLVTSSSAGIATASTQNTKLGDQSEKRARISKFRRRIMTSATPTMTSSSGFGDATALRKSRNALRKIREDQLRQKQKYGDLTSNVNSGTTANVSSTSSSSSVTTCNEREVSNGNVMSNVGKTVTSSSMVRSRRCMMRGSASDKRKKRKRNC